MQAACAGGALSAGCRAVLQALKANGAAGCAVCLAPFVVPYAQGTGVFSCAAPYLDAACNHATGCYADCEAKSCQQCPAGQEAQCENRVRAGACGTYTQGLACVIAAVNGPGAFCNPASYRGYGAWLKGVGGHYCQ